MNKMWTIMMGMIIITLISELPLHAKEIQEAKAVQEGKAAIADVQKIDLTLKKSEQDDVGTDVENIYTITIEPAGQSNQFYTVIYYLDGRFVEEFQNVQLPYSFIRNFKGQNRGDHVIKIELELGEENIIAARETTINVDYLNNKLERMNMSGQK